MSRSASRGMRSVLLCRPRAAISSASRQPWESISRFHEDQSPIPASASRTVIQGPAQRPHPVVTRDPSVEGRGRGVLVTGLVLDEQGIHAGFDRMGDVGTAQRVDVQAGGEAQVLAVAVEPPVQRSLDTRVPRSDGKRSSPSVMFACPRSSQSATISPDQSNTVRTLLGASGEPLHGRPVPDLQDPVFAELAGVRVAGKSTVCRCRTSLRRSPQQYATLNRTASRVGRQPALAAWRRDPVHSIDSARSKKACSSRRANGRRPGDDSDAWAWTAVFQSKQTCEGCAPKYRSQTLSHP